MSRWPKRRPFDEARAFVRTLGLRNQAEWYAYAKSADRPADIPTNPHAAYKDEFQGYGDWLGTGNVPKNKNHRKRSLSEDERKKKDAERAQKWRQEHPEKARDVSHAYLEQNREKLAEKARSERAANPQKVIERSQKYNSKHREERNEQASRWRAEHPEASREATRRYRSKRIRRVLRYDNLGMRMLVDQKSRPFQISLYEDAERGGASEIV